MSSRKPTSAIVGRDLFLGNYLFEMLHDKA